MVAVGTLWGVVALNTRYVLHSVGAVPMAEQFHQEMYSV